MSSTISAEAREFLGRRPVRIITTARIVLFVNALLILGSLWCIRYPDVIKAPVVINAAGQGEMRISSKELIRPGQKVRITLYHAEAGGPEYRDGVVEQVMPVGVEGQRAMQGEQRTMTGAQRILIWMPASGGGYPTEGCIMTEDRRLLSRLLKNLNWGRADR